MKLVARAREGICVTSYEQLRRQRAHLIGVHWGYVVLDEGHKIRNPDAEVTLAAKQLATVCALPVLHAHTDAAFNKSGRDAVRTGIAHDHCF